MEHGWNTDKVTARREPRSTGRAKLLLSPISAPLPHSVFDPWPQSLSGARSEWPLSIPFLDRKQGSGNLRA